jgi:NIMA (never in mitosis gene a)-related kinase 1/4/5
MEFADNGDLLQQIEKTESAGCLMDEDTFIWPVFISIVKALKQLHSMKIFHRDLKSANVFLYNDGSAKLGDLNVSKVAKKGLLYT